MIAMRQIMADFAKQTGQEPSAFQGAALCTFAREPLTPPERLAAAQAMGNRPVPPEWFEFDLCCGRQGGKSSFIVPCLVLYSMLNAHELFGAHAQRPATIVVVAPVSRQGRITLNAVTRAVEQHPVLTHKISSRNKEEGELEFFTLGITIRIVPANPRTARGNPTCLLIADEVDFFLADDQGNANWPDLYEALRPGLVTWANAKVLKVSSPAGTNGVLFQDLQRAESGDQSLVFFHATTEQMNPNADPKFIQRERERNAAYASREYDAKFLDTAGMWLRSEEIKNAQALEADASIEELWKIVCASVEEDGGVVSTPVLAFDLANKGKDRCTYAIAARVDYDSQTVPFAVVLRVKAYEREQFQPMLDPRPCVEEGLAEAAKLGVRVACGDQIMAGYVFGAARDIGIEFKDKVTGTESLKAHEIFAHVQPLFRESRVLIPEDAKLARELAGLEDRFSKMKSNTPHDDMATACVAALDQAVFVELPSIKPWHFVA